MKLGQNCPKIESRSPDKILHQKYLDAFKMTKKTPFSAKVLAISGSFDEKPSKMGKK